MLVCVTGAAALKMHLRVTLLVLMSTVLGAQHSVRSGVGSQRVTNGIPGEQR